MADNSSTVTLDSGSPQRVALDLVNHIAYYDKTPAEARDRAYWLQLYRECFVVVRGG